MSSWNTQLTSLATAVQQSPELPAAKREQLLHQIQTAKESALTSDKWVYRIVVSVLGLAVLLALILSFWFAWGTDKALPDIFLALGSAAVGALAGLLAPSPLTRA